MDPDALHVSTGELPPADRVRGLVQDAYDRFHGNTEGRLSTVYPALTKIPPGLFGVAVVAVSGRLYVAGDADRPFTIMSVAKPFVFALVAQALGPEDVKKRVGVNATGLPFNAVAPLERSSRGRTNPMVNAGALATTSLVPGATGAEKNRFLMDGLSLFAGRKLEVDREVYASAIQAHHRNQGLAWLLHDLDLLGAEPEVALELYTRQSSLAVTARDLAVMGATLADGGVNPVTSVRVVSPEVCRDTLAVMATAGFYETSGDWLFDVGVPGKSGIGGGIVAAAPGKGALGTYGPLLDGAGNSVKGQLAARFLSRTLGLSVFSSDPIREPTPRADAGRGLQA